MVFNKNKKDSSIYKFNSNLINFLAQKDEIKQLSRVERDNQVVSYGKKTYLSKLINFFRSDKTPTSEYWLEVGE